MPAPWSLKSAPHGQSIIRKTVSLWVNLMCTVSWVVPFSVIASWFFWEVSDIARSFDDDLASVERYFAAFSRL